MMYDELLALLPLHAIGTTPIPNAILFVLKTAG